MSVHFGPGSLSGRALQGQNWVRILYLDEAGIGSLEHDPILVVAGVLIHADTQWHAIGQRLDSLLSSATPIGQTKPSAVHAKDIFHGSKEFDRNNWPLDVRLKLLEDIAKIPSEFDIPVVWDAINRKASHPLDLNSTSDELIRDQYSTATLACIMQVEILMRSSKDYEHEVASIILEENRNLQRRMPELMNFIRSADDNSGLLEGWRNVMPFVKIIDNPAAQVKTSSSVLQLADVCAFAIKRLLQKSKNASDLTGHFAHQLLMYRPNSLEEGLHVWSPKFMPHKWGGNVYFERGKWVKKSKKSPLLVKANYLN